MQQQNHNRTIKYIETNVHQVTNRYTTNSKIVSFSEKEQRNRRVLELVQTQCFLTPVVPTVVANRLQHQWDGRAIIRSEAQRIPRADAHSFKRKQHKGHFVSDEVNTKQVSDGTLRLSHSFWGQLVQPPTRTARRSVSRLKTHDECCM